MGGSLLTKDTVRAADGTTTGGQLTGAGGAAISGVVQGIGTVWAAQMAADSAKKQRKQEKALANSNTKLTLAEDARNQDRLAGLSASMSGTVDQYGAQAKGVLDNQYASTDWNQKYDADVSSGLISADNIGSGDMYQKYTYDNANKNAYAGALSEFKDKGEYAKLDFKDYEIK